MNSRLTLVDVVVRSGNGVVPGLTKANFRLTENGVPQQIASVEEHTGAASTSAAPVPKLPPNTYTNYAPPGQTGVCVVLLDALNTPQKDQMYARQQLLAYLKDLPPGTSTAVFALGSQLRLLQPFSADPAALLAAINSPRANLSVSPVLEDSSTAPEKASDSAQDNVDSRPPQTAQQAAEQGTPDLVANLRQFEAEQDTFNYEFRVRVTMSALAEIAAYVHSQPGRKSLVWISGSFPSSILPNQELGTAAFNATSNLSPLIQRTTAMLTNARISVYPIDARGLMTSSTYDAGSRQGSRYASPHQATALQNADAQFGAKQASEHSAMSAVAEQTGGRAFFNTNGIRQAIAEAATEGERYYTVAYVPTDKNYDNTVRHVAIKVVPGNYQLSYRKSYIAGDPRAESLAQGFGTLDSLHAAFESGAPGSSEILFDISIVRKNATPGAAPAGKVVDWSGKVDRYALDYAIDGKDLHPEMLGGGKAHLDLDIVAIAYDDLGRAVNTMSQVLTADLSPQQTANLQHGALPFHQEIDLPRKTVFLRVGVAEKASGRTGSLEITLPPAK